MAIVKPLLSVVMPVYNTERFIAKAITSVLNQTFAAFEFIIVNDGSTDRTIEIVRSFEDERIHLINQENGGIAQALNTGLLAATTNYIARFDADDICHPERLGLQFAIMQDNADLVLIGSAVDYIDEQGTFVFKWNPPAYDHEAISVLPKEICPFIHSSVLFRRDKVMECGGYNIHAHSFEDHLLWQNIIEHGKVCNLEASLVKVRLNPHSVTIDEKWRPDTFHQIKYAVLQKGYIDEQEGDALKEILASQNIDRIKQGAYYALLGKKYLWNNYQPAKARHSLRKALFYNPFYTIGYGLWIASFLPERLISKLYRKHKTNL